MSRRCRVPVLLAALAAVLSASAAADPGPDAALDVAVLQRDWPAVAARAAGDGPAARMLRGHAYLALNRNDESVCLFAGLDPDAGGEWARWTRAFLSRHPGAPMAHYLRGDALARQGEMEQAIAQFGLGLVPGPGDALLLNARGVAQAVAKNWSAATVDLDAAHGLADALANQGVVALLQGQAATRAVERFDRALAEAPRFTLARSGRAIAQLALGQIGAAQSDAAAAIGAGACLPELIGRAVERAVAEFDARQRRPTSDEDEAPGVSMVASLEAIKKGRMGGVDRLARIVGDNPALAPMVARELQRIAVADPDLGRRVRNRLELGRDVLGPTGPVRAVVDLFKGVSVSAGLQGGPSTKPPPGRTATSAHAGVSVSFADFSKDVQGWVGRAHAGYQLLAPKATRPGVWPEGRIGGASSNAAAARWDLGDGPAVAEFGLLYRAHALPAR